MRPLQGMRLVAATGNAHKLREIERITADFGIELISKSDAGIADLDVEETGETFEENSFLKANEIMKATGMAAIADDLSNNLHHPRSADPFHQHLLSNLRNYNLCG